MTIPIVGFWIVLALTVAVVIYIVRQIIRDRSQINLANALTFLTGALVVILVFLFPYAFPQSSNVSTVRVIDWDGYRSFDKLLLDMQGCIDSTATSNIYGTKPMYFVEFEVNIELIIVNDGNVSNGIVKVEAPYEQLAWTVYMTKSPVWYIATYSSNESNDQIDFPVEMPARVPRKLNFRGYSAVEAYPDVDYGSVANYAESLSPIKWTLTTIDGQQVVHDSDLFVTAPEATDNGKFKFDKECNTLVPKWPLPILGTQIDSSSSMKPK